MTNVREVEIPTEGRRHRVSEYAGIIDRLEGMKNALEMTFVDHYKARSAVRCISSAARKRFPVSSSVTGNVARVWRRQA